VGRPRVVKRAEGDARKNLERSLLGVLLDDYASEVHRLDLRLCVSEEPGEALIGREMPAAKRQVVVNFGRATASHEESERSHKAIPAGARLIPTPGL
jgi:hypothetical protein